jgi:hypothetical protein
MKPEHLSALKKILTALEGQPINWAITGSLGFALQGVKVEVHDIDIQTDRESAYTIQQLFSDYMTKEVRFSSTDRIRSHFGAFEIDGIEVEIMGDIQKKLTDATWEDPINPRDHLVWIEFEGMRIPVLSLPYEYQAYIKLGRFEKAEMLRQYLETGNHQREKPFDRA